MKVLREFVLLTFLAVAYGFDNLDNRSPAPLGFRVPSHLMEAYMFNGVLTKIPWPSFKSLEKLWSSMLNPGVSDATATKLNRFFTELQRAKDNLHQAMDSVVSMCSSSMVSLPVLLEKKSIYNANKALARIMESFAESKSHLYNVKYNLEFAAETISSLEPQPDKSNIKKFLITDLNDGTVVLETLGEQYEHPEDLSKVLQELSKHYISSDQPVTIKFRAVANRKSLEPAQNSKGPGMIAPSTRRSAPADNQGLSAVAFFSRLSVIRSELNLAIKSLDAFITHLDSTLRSFTPVTQPPTTQHVGVLIDKCERYNPEF